MLDRFKKKYVPTPLDDQIASVLDAMEKTEASSKEYSELVKHLSELNKIKTESRPKSISRDTMLIVAGNLMGILIIIAYEQKHVLTSKGFSQLPKPKF